MTLKFLPVAVSMCLNGKNKAPVKIIFFSANLYSSFFSESVKTFGGVSRIYRIIKRLSEIGKYKLVCYTGDSGQSAHIEKNGITLIKSDINKPLRVFGIYRQLVRYPSDLMVDFFASPRIFLLSILKKFHKRKYVFFAGSDIDVNGGYRKLSNPLFYYLYGVGLKHADKIICQTEAQAVSLKKKYHLESEVVLSPYVDITPSKGLNREFILWVGRSIFYKGPFHFLELARAIPEEEFVMISNPSNDLRFHEKLKKISFSIPNLRFIEAVPFEEMPGYFARAKFLVNTSDFEGVPNTFIEAAMEETPILSLNVDPNQMLSRHGAGICAKGSFHDMVNAANGLLSDTERLKRMGKIARSYAVSNHDMDVAIEKIQTIFDEVLKK